MIEAEVRGAFVSGGKRDFVSDLQRFIAREGIKSHFESDGSVLSYPTIVAANHFTRKIKDRVSFDPIRMFGNSLDTLVVAGLVSIGAKQLTSRDTAWIVEEDLKFKSRFIGIGKWQKAAISTFDHIPMSKDTRSKQGLAGSSETISSVLEQLGKGKNVALFPEGEPGFKMHSDYRNFTALLMMLRRKKIPFQVLPASVYFENGVFVVRFSQAIPFSNDPRTDAAAVIAAISSKLPLAMRPQF